MLSRLARGGPAEAASESERRERTGAGQDAGEAEQTAGGAVPERLGAGAVQGGPIDAPVSARAPRQAGILGRTRDTSGLRGVAGPASWSGRLVTVDLAAENVPFAAVSS
jgi:hypothetical protein